MKLQYKSAIVIFVFGVIFLVAISILYYLYSSKLFLKTKHDEFRMIAQERTQDVDRFLKEKVKTTVTITTAPILIDSLTESNSNFERMTIEEREDEIIKLNNRWMETENIFDPFIQSYISNPVADYLKSQQEKFPYEYGEIFLTNRYGALIASTSKLTTLAHAQKYWWIASYDDGKGRVFFDDRGYDKSVGGYVLGIVVPIKKDNEIIGILKCNLNIIGALRQIIEDFKLGDTGHLEIVRSGGLIVIEKDKEPLTAKISEVHIEHMRKRIIESHIINYEGHKSLGVCAPISITLGSKQYGFGGTHDSIDHIKGNMGESWFVLLSQDLSEVLISLRNTMKWIFLVGILFIILMGIISIFLGRRTARPIIQLRHCARKVGQGDFETKIDIQSKDELGELASSFNSMIQNLKETTISRDLLSDEVERRKQIEVVREKLIEELKEALAKVKTLSGFIPICSHCKKIRDDKGYWTQVEEYVRDHTEAEFSHSLCPDCIKKYYPEYYNKVVSNEKNKRIK